jgi:hypothetical protein
VHDDHTWIDWAYMRNCSAGVVELLPEDVALGPDLSWIVEQCLEMMVARPSGAAAIHVAPGTYYFEQVVMLMVQDVGDG